MEARTSTQRVGAKTRMTSTQRVRATTHVTSTQRMRATTRVRARTRMTSTQRVRATTHRVGAQQLHGAIAEGPAAIDNANHYLGGAATVFGDVQQNTPGIKQLFIELASVMSGVGHPKESGTNPDDWVHMWRVYCAKQCFEPSK